MNIALQDAESQFLHLLKNVSITLLICRMSNRNIAVTIPNSARENINLVLFKALQSTERVIKIL